MSWIFVECTYHHRRGRILSLEGDPNLSSCPCLPYHRGERYHRYFIAVLACHQPVGENDFITINMCIPSCLFACPVFGGGYSKWGGESSFQLLRTLCVCCLRSSFVLPDYTPNGGILHISIYDAIRFDRESSSCFACIIFIGGGKCHRMPLGIIVFQRVLPASSVARERGSSE